MDMLQQFGVGEEAYIFPQAQQKAIDNNFGDTLQQSQRVIGKDGGIPVYGTGRAPSEMGNLPVTFIIEGVNAHDVGSQIKTLRGLPFRGQQRLFMRHRTGIQMWTWAMCSSVRTPQNVSNVPHLRQLVQLTFQCMDSKWYAKDGMQFFNSGNLMNDGLSMPSIKLDSVGVDDGDTVTVTNNGNAPASPYIRWDIPTGVTATNPTLTWSNVDGNVVYSVQYTDDLVGGDVVIIDCRKNAVSPSYSNLVVTHGAWLEIAPGAQTLTVSGTFSNDINLTVDFWDTWV